MNIKRQDQEPFADYKKRTTILNKLTEGYIKGRKMLFDKVSKKFVSNGLTGKLTELYSLSLSELKIKIGMVERA